MTARVPPPGPVPPSAGAFGPPTGMVPEAPRAILRLADGTVIDGTVIGRDAAGRTTVKTGIGLLPLAVDPPLPVGSRLSLEIRRDGGRLLATVLAVEPPPTDTGAIRAAPQPAPPRPPIARGSIVTGVVTQATPIPGGTGAGAGIRQAPAGATPLPAGAEMTLRIVEIAPPGTAGASVAPPPSALAGTVAGATPAGHLVVETARGRLVLTTAGAPALPPGSRVVMEIVAAPPTPSPGESAPSPGPSRDWAVLAEAAALLDRSGPGGPPAPPLPRLGPGLAAGLLALLAALRRGDLPGWVDAALGKPLERAGHGALAAKVRQEFAPLARAAAEATGGEDWRLVTLPLLDGTTAETARLYLRGRRRDAEPAGGPEDAGSRFVLEVELSRLGPLQLDGLVRARRFDLMLRSRRPLTPHMRRDIADIFDEARAIGGLAGRIEFATADPFPAVPLGRGRHGEGIVV